MNELALFAGAGGGILGGHLLGWRCVCAVEINDYARRVLLARQRDGMLPRFPIWDDITTFDGCPWRGRVDVISGGFPCQDISAAGKGAGITGERSGLWSHMARVIGEVGPRWVFVENSPMLISRGIEIVLGDLASLGYDAAWGVIGAHHIGAPHKRDRIWIVADSGSQRYGDAKSEVLPGWNAIKSGRGNVANAECAERRPPGACECRNQGWVDSNGLREREEMSGRVGAGCEVVAYTKGGGFAVRGRASGKGRYALRNGVPSQGGEEYLANTSGAGLEGRKQPGTLRNKRGGGENIWTN